MVQVIRNTAGASIPGNDGDYMPLTTDDSGRLRTGLVQADGGDVTQGAVADAAVFTDAVGTISGKMRGLVRLMASFLTRHPAALAASGGLKIEGVAGGVAAPISVAAGGLAANSFAAGSFVAGAFATGAITDLPVVGQAAMAASVPVAIASNQSAVPVKVAIGGIAAGGVAAGAVVSGAVLSGAFATGAIVDLPNVGQEAMVGSVPVVIANNQSAVAVSGAVTVSGTATTTAVASEAHVGKTTGRAFTVPVVAVITDSAYVIGDAVGGSLAFAGVARVAGAHFKINTVRLVTRLTLLYTVWILDAELAAGACADLDPLTFAAADVAKVYGSIPIAAADYVAVPTDLSVATVRNVGLQGKCAAASTGIVVYVMAGEVTDTNTTSLILTLEGEMID